MCESPPQPPPTCSTYLWLVPVLLGQLLPIPARPYTHIHTCTHASDTHARTSSHLHAHIRHTLVPHHPIYVHTHILHTHTHTRLPYTSTPNLDAVCSLRTLVASTTADTSGGAAGWGSKAIRH